MLEDNVEFKNLGLVVTDEQHRFGVRQRNKIAQKGSNGQNPDVLVMSATPIPRTLALILYGDLDISIIDELPPNRKKIETFAVTKRLQERVDNFIEKQIKEGRQAYIVCPLVEESEESDLKSVVELAKKYDLKWRIDKLFISINSSNKWKLGNLITECPYIKGKYIIDTKYDREIGLLLENDEEYSISSREL